MLNNEIPKPFRGAPALSSHSVNICISIKEVSDFDDLTVLVYERVQ